MAKKSASKAVKAASANKKGVNQKRDRKFRPSVHFHRPKTLQKGRKPEYSRRAAPRATKMDMYRVLRVPVTTESAMTCIETDNTLVFVVDVLSNKKQIKNSVEQMYSVKVARVNTLVRPNGTKKAFVKLEPNYDSMEVATKIGII